MTLVYSLAMFLNIGDGVCFEQLNVKGTWIDAPVKYRNFWPRFMFCECSYSRQFFSLRGLRIF